MGIRQIWRRIAGLCLGVAAAYLLWRRRRGPARLPYQTQWTSELARRYDAETAQSCLDQAEQLFRDLCAGFQRPFHPVLRYHLTYQILPALALYRALSEDLDDPATALDLTDQLVWSELRVFYRIATAFLAGLPRPFPVWRRLVRFAMRTIFPPAGWRRRPAVDTSQRYGFDIVGCIYLDTLRSLGAPELTLIFCAMDDRLAQMIPTSINWQRAGTLARGHAQCDFRWSDQEAQPSTCTTESRPPVRQLQ